MYAANYLVPNIPLIKATVSKNHLYKILKFERFYHSEIDKIPGRAKFKNFFSSGKFIIASYIHNLLVILVLLKNLSGLKS